MTKIDLNNRDFEIKIEINNSFTTIKVNTEETTDGVEYFTCRLKNEQITQIRREKDGNWEQIWGKLDPKTIDTIGAAINTRIENS